MFAKIQNNLIKLKSGIMSTLQHKDMHESLHTTAHDQHMAVCMMALDVIPAIVILLNSIEMGLSMDIYPDHAL